MVLLVEAGELGLGLFIGAKVVRWRRDLFRGEKYLAHVGMWLVGLAVSWLLAMACARPRVAGVK